MHEHRGTQAPLAAVWLTGCVVRAMLDEGACAIASCSVRPCSSPSRVRRSVTSGGLSGLVVRGPAVASVLDHARRRLHVRRPRHPVPGLRLARDETTGCIRDVAGRPEPPPRTRTEARHRSWPATRLTLVSGRRREQPPAKIPAHARRGRAVPGRGACSAERPRARHHAPRPMFLGSTFVLHCEDRSLCSASHPRHSETQRGRAAGTGTVPAIHARSTG
jgi:hypothetical protein